MKRGALASLVLLGSAALATPGTPVLDAPIDGGWCARACSVGWHFAPVAQTVATGIEVTDDQGAAVASTTASLQVPPDDSWTTPALPDAGFFSWRVRGIDDAGTMSAWSGLGTFRVDGIAPPAPASVTASFDGGWLRLVSAPVVDQESGLKVYHFGASVIDQLDGGLVFNTAFFTQRQGSPSRDLWLGPGSWMAGVHAHDNVENAGVTALAGPFVVPVSATLPTPAPPVLARSDAGVWSTWPFVPTSAPSAFTDAGGARVTQWVFSRRVPGTDAGWELAGYGPGVDRNQLDITTGPSELRVALVSGTEVSDWSAPVSFHIDTHSPLALTVSARVDGGLVRLSWPYGRDTSTDTSGLNRYEVTRAGADGSVSLPDVPHVASAISTTDAPGYGTWTYGVRSVDNAGNKSAAAMVTASVAPATPSGFRAVAPVTSPPVELVWDADDGGVEWTVSRVDALDASVVVGQTAVPGLVDDAPEGRWSYELFAAVPGVRGPSARVDGVVRDVTPPTVSVPVVTVVDAQQVEVAWTADDALSGVASVELQREGAAGVVPVGLVSSPASDVPGEAVRYRVVVSDVAGNVATSEWSEVVDVEGVPRGRRRLTAGCGCSSGGAEWLVLLVFAWRRRRVTDPWWRACERSCWRCP
ncbi:MAG: hypothetical protein U0228_31165 [Myxococcaceae bacterium]